MTTISYQSAMTVDKFQGELSKRLVQLTRYLIECPATEKAVTCLPDSLKLLLQILFVGRSKLLGDIILFKLQGERLCFMWASSLVEIQSHLDGSLWKPHRNN